MINTSFSISYNGHPAAVTELDNNTFMVQISYKPVYIQLQDNEAKEKWVEVESQQETFLSTEIGRKISSYLQTCRQGV